MLESDIQKQCLELLKLYNIYCWRQNTGAFKKGKSYIKFAFKGCSDILGICPDGRFLAVECKRTSGGILSDEQKEFLVNIKKNGGVAIIANSVERLKEELISNNVVKK